VIWLALVLMLGVAGYASVVFAEHRQQDMTTYRLRFPRQLSERDAQSVVGLLSGLPHGQYVVIEAHGTRGKIEHLLHIPSALAGDLIAKIHALLPGLRYERIMTRSSDLSRAVAIRHNAFASLRTDAIASTSTALLASLSGVGNDGQLVIQWIVGGGIPPKPRNGNHQSVEIRGELRSARRDKVKHQIVGAYGRIGVRHLDPKATRRLLRSVTSVLRALRTTHGDLRFVGLLSGRRAALLNARARPWMLKASMLSTPELASMLAWPVDVLSTSGLSLADSPMRRAGLDVSHRGRVFGRSNFSGDLRQIAQTQLGSLSHTLLAGPSGSGKTTELTNLVISDLASGRNVIVIDGKGDLSKSVLERAPANRLEDMHVLDLGHGTASSPVAGLKLFDRSVHPELAADLVLGVIADLFADSWGPRSEQWLRVGLSTIATLPGATLADLPFLYTDARFRRQLVGELSNPFLRSSWMQFESMSERERIHALSAPLNKLDALLGRSRLRAVLGQTEPAIDVEEIMNRSGVLIVNLATGSAGSLASRLLGALVMFEVYRVTAGRSRLPVKSRRPVSVVIDEPRALVGMPVPLDVLFEQARGHGVALTVAVQSVTQLPEGIARSLLSNVATIGTFRQNADDANLLARQFSDVEARDLQGLEQFELVLRMGLGNGRVSAPLTLVTQPTTAKLRSAASVTKTYVGEHGKTPEEVDQALFDRHGLGQPINGNDPAASEGVGRVRRSK
jgi:hypothetical protein